VKFSRKISRPKQLCNWSKKLRWKSLRCLSEL
jgi:hypothetical protein